MEREEHERLADELADETDRLEERSDELGQDIDHTRSDWRAKQTDPAVPGAVEPPGDEGAQGSRAERTQDSRDERAQDSAEEDGPDNDGEDDVR